MSSASDSTTPLADVTAKLAMPLDVMPTKTEDFIRRIAEVVPSSGNISRRGILAALEIEAKSPDGRAVDHALNTMVEHGVLQKQGRGTYSHNDTRLGP